MPTHSHLSITSEITSSHNTVVIGTYQQIVDAAIAESLEIPGELMNLAVERLKKQSSIQFFVNQKLVCLSLLPTQHSRHNSPTHADKVTSICKQTCHVDNWDIILLSNAYALDAHIASVAKAFPIFQSKTSTHSERLIHIIPFHHENTLNQQILVDNIRLCGNLVESTPQSLPRVYDHSLRSNLGSRLQQCLCKNNPWSKITRQGTQWSLVGW